MSLKEKYKLEKEENKKILRSDIQKQEEKKNQQPIKEKANLDKSKEKSKKINF